MPGGFYRGQAAEYNIFKQLLDEYMKGLGGQGFQDVLQNLTTTAEPTIQELMGKFGHQAASLGNVVPGQGFSSAAQGGEQNLMSKFMSDIMGQALQTYTMPWGAKFGAVPGISGQYQGASGGAGFEDLIGQLFGVGAGGFMSGVGGQYASGINWPGLPKTIIT